MPHVQIEYSEDLNKKIDPLLFKSLINILIEFANVNPENCKCKAWKVKEYYLQSNKLKESFIHLDIKILEGRSKKIINQIGEKSMQVLQSFIKSRAKKKSIQYSIEIQEMKHSNYFTSNNI